MQYVENNLTIFQSSDSSMMTASITRCCLVLCVVVEVPNNEFCQIIVEIQ